MFSTSYILTWDTVSSTAGVLGFLLASYATIRGRMTRHSNTTVGSVAPAVSVMAEKKKDRILKLMYVLADMRGHSIKEAEERVEFVQKQFIALMRLGIYGVAVGVNTEFTMRDYVDPDMFQEAGRELAARCDGILLIPKFEEDPEAVEILAHAQKFGVKTFVSSEGMIQDRLKAWAVDEET